MRLLALIATAVNLLAGLFVLSGLCSYGWYNVSYSAVVPIKANQTVSISSTFSIFGIVEYKLNIGDNSTIVWLNHWMNKTSCAGDDCPGVTYNANRACDQLADIRGESAEPEDTQSFRSWYYGAACNFPKPTIAMMVLALICFAPAIPFGGLCAFDLAPPLIPMAINAVGWLWLFLAMCIYGGGVSAKANTDYWTDDNAMVRIRGSSLYPIPDDTSIGLGAAYGLPCTAMFLILIVIGLLFVEWRKEPQSGTSKAHEMTRV